MSQLSNLIFENMLSRVCNQWLLQAHTSIFPSRLCFVALVINTDYGLITPKFLEKSSHLLACWCYKKTWKRRLTNKFLKYIIMSFYIMIVVLICVFVVGLIACKLFSDCKADAESAASSTIRNYLHIFRSKNNIFINPSQSEPKVLILKIRLPI